MKISHTVHEIEAGSIEEFLEKLGPILKDHLNGNEDEQRNETMLKFELACVQKAEAFDIDPVDYCLSTLKMCAAMSVKIADPARRDRFVALMHEGFDRYFNEALKFFEEINKEPSMYDAGKGRRDDVRSNAEKQAKQDQRHVFKERGLGLD